ncbi:hypothetical protein BJY01DRAFT_236831 [Aspergillus pseudoustus]|uniref:Zn(2)-C6 fungal-type domain-containing protein n=1 Tax=Aspergillus pseudoustus TaxID=1810923 RepID=A0ABR4JJJ9_9EURO
MPSSVIQKRTSKPAPLACTECRLRHLKCDGKQPHCARCLNSNLPCQYLKSRRGGRKKKPVDPRESEEYAELLHASVGSAGDPPDERRLGSRSGSSSVGTHDEAFTELPQENEPLPEALLKLYYENFHRAHPILVSEELFQQRQYPKFLTAIVALIGGLYSSSFDPTLRARATQQMILLDEKSISAVQARLLYSITVCGEGSIDEARVQFTSARDIAIELQMNRHNSLTTPLGDAELDSYRRTWWELYIVDGYMTVIWPSLGFVTSALACDVPVPLEQPHVYFPSETDQFSPDILLSEDDDRTLSPWWHRIQAATLLTKVVLLPDQDKAQAAMAALATWRLSLPPEKAQFMDPFGRVNALLFHAEVLAQTASLILHFPRSDLHLALEPRITTANTLLAPAGTTIPIRTCTRKVHGIKATESSKEICNLFSIYPSMETCSPLLVPCLAACGLVQLATYQAHERNGGDCRELHRDRKVWRVARRAYEEIKGVASEVFRDREERGERTVEQGGATTREGTIQGFLPPNQGGAGLSSVFNGLEAGFQDLEAWPWIQVAYPEEGLDGHSHSTDQYPLEI